MRGVLILAVILDHNDIIRNVRPVQDAFLPMTFHVTGFLFLPFLLPHKRVSWGIVSAYVDQLSCTVLSGANWLLTSL